MKIRNTYMTIAALAAYILSSCTAEIEDPNGFEKIEDGTILAEIPAYHRADQGTKANISDDLSVFTWSDGDQIGVEYSDGITDAFTRYTILKGGSSIGSFRNDAFRLRQDSEYYVTYPSADYDYPATLFMNFRGQFQSANNSAAHIGPRNYMTAIVRTDANHSAKFKFQNQAAILQITFALPKDTEIKSLEIESLRKELILESFIQTKSNQYIPLETSSSLEMFFGTEIHGPGIKVKAGEPFVANMLFSRIDLYGSELVFTVRDVEGNVVKTFHDSGKRIDAGNAYSFGTADVVIEPDPDAEYVDLGLPSGTLWATCNLGATKPEEYGLYYQWGDTQGYSSDTSDGKYFFWSNRNGNVTYKWCNGSYNSLTKYNTNSSYGTVDNKTVLEMDDDAARAALGGNWRMPTDAEWTELRENCTWTWTSNYNGTGVAGMIVTSKKSGYTNKSIFLPEAGYRYNDVLFNAGSYGFFWSSSLSTDNPGSAWTVYFSSGDVGRGNGGRYYRQSVRPVYTETKATPSISVTPTDLDFGTVKVGSSATASFTVTNTGSAVANVSISAPSAPVTSDVSGNITLNAGASKTVTLTYSPKEKGSVGGSISVVSGGNTVTVRYSGNAEENTGGYSYEYVDLGLSVKWATCNLGATKPEEYGLYYQWGDTQGYGSDTSDGKYFYWKDGAGNVTYKWCNGSEYSLTKYNTDSSYGTVDNKTVLDMEDDAARAALGGNWRIPTDAEWTELRENCTWTWTNDYNGTGVAGRIVTSNKTGYTDKSIFLPAAGYRSYDDLFPAGSHGLYWSSSLYSGSPRSAWLVFFSSVGVYGDGGRRYSGQSVRPVSE